MSLPTCWPCRSSNSHFRTVDDDLKSKRDRALILVGFAGAFHRSEVVGLTVAAVQFTNDGLIVKLQRSKTDQEGAGQAAAIAA